MALAPGTRLGAYEVSALIGAGGMGEVYRARDCRLNRQVAVKLLPAALANDVERRARFTREAHLLASLNHSNIAQIYGFEDSGVVHALVLELVEGPTLADRLVTGPLPLRETLAVASQIADALDASIEPHGVGVHIEAVHLCTQMRGVREEHSKTVTGVWRGGYSDNPELRREFLAEICNRNSWT